ncbi:MAG: metal-sensing transcriptional repressor [Andreesenia angusta]|nr:metal-sensing transcriptional repressor [Andreesenia angusta]
MDSSKLNRRINKVIGQLNAVNRMLEEGRPCEDILIQLNASKKAIHKVGQVLLEQELDMIIEDKIEIGEVKEISNSFKKSLDLFSRL